MPLRLDPLTSDLFDCLHETHERIRFERDPLRFCQALDIQYVLGPSNMARVARWQSGPDLIVVRHEQHTSRDLFTIAHEAAHIIAKREGYIRLIKRHHQAQDMKRHIELLMNEGAGRLLMPLPDLEAATREHGDTPRAILHLAEVSGASLPVALRRWVRQDWNESRAAFEIEGNYVQDVTAWNARLPFWKWDRVPDVALEHPDLMLLGLGQGRVLGTLVG